jgi:hypothetical protein
MSPVIRRESMKQPLVFTLIPVAALAAILVASRAQASVKGDSIGVKFGADQPTPDGSHLSATAVAGAPGIESTNWNNAEGPGDSLENLVRDTSGTATATAATVIWATTNTFNSGSNDNFRGDDHSLMLGYLDQNADATPIRVRFIGLPDDFETYDVYVYFLGSNPHRGGVYTVNGVLFGEVSQFGFVGVEDTGPDYVDAGQVVPPAKGNYLVFRGLSGSTIDITADNDIDNRCPINAIEIVNTTRAANNVRSTLK